MPARRAYDTTQAATYLGVRRSRLTQWRKQGLGPSFIKQGRGFFYYIDELEDWLNANRLVPRHPASPITPKDTKDPRPLTDEEWRHVRPLIRDANNGGRLFIDAVLYILWTNRPWHLLPLEYGNHNKVRDRFINWGKIGKWEEIIGELSVFPDFPYRFVKRDSICVTNFKAVDREQVVTHFLDVDQRTIGPLKIPFKTQRRIRTRLFPTFEDHMRPERQAELYGQFKHHKRR